MKDKDERRSMERINGPHTEGRNVLILYRLTSPRKRLDKRIATHLLEYRWLSESGGVQGSDYVLLTTNEAQPMIGAASLFEHAELF